MDQLFEELFGVDSVKAINFFLTQLLESPGTKNFRYNDICYVASVLAHYAQTSRCDTSCMPVLANLAEVFDHFIMPTTALNDAEILAVGGSQVLLFAGFFRDQMRRRHNVRWYDQIGQSLYERAGQYSGSLKERELFDRLAENFPNWTHICCLLNRNLRQNHLLLKFN